MIHTELDAAGIRDPQLRHAYRECRALNARHGRTFFLATRLLAPAQRPPVHALYGFARTVDDIVDDLDAPVDTNARAARLDSLVRQLRGPAEERDSVVSAVLHAAHVYGISMALFDSFVASMRMDLTVTDYLDRAALDRYVYGSAEVIGLQLLPVLGSVGPLEAAAPYAAALGRAFQLTNFLRDISEDLRRGRVYLPADELAAFGVDRELLMWCQAHQRTDARVRRALAAQHAVTRAIYSDARTGIEMLAPGSRQCVQTAFTLYSEILDRIEDMDYAVFRHRATVGILRRVRVAAPAVIRARSNRREGTAPQHVLGIADLTGNREGTR